MLVSTDEAIHALNAATGATVWSRPGRVDHGAVAADGVAYYGDGANLWAVDAATGAERWQRPIGDFTRGLAVGASAVFVNAGSELVAVRRSDGVVSWRSPTPDGWSFGDGVPAVAGGRVYVPSSNGGVYDEADGDLLRPISAASLFAVDGVRTYALTGSRRRGIRRFQRGLDRPEGGLRGRRHRRWRRRRARTGGRPPRDDRHTPRREDHDCPAAGSAAYKSYGDEPTRLADAPAHAVAPAADPCLGDALPPAVSAHLQDHRLDLRTGQYAGEHD